MNPVIFYNFSSSEASKVTDLRSKSDNLIETRIERNVVENNTASNHRKRKLGFRHFYIIVTGVYLTKPQYFSINTIDKINKVCYT